jgi:hypothetical protein
MPPKDPRGGVCYCNRGLRDRGISAEGCDITGNQRSGQVAVTGIKNARMVRR